MNWPGLPQLDLAPTLSFLLSPHNSSLRMHGPVQLFFLHPKLWTPNVSPHQVLAQACSPADARDQITVEAQPL